MQERIVRSSVRIARETSRSAADKARQTWQNARLRAGNLYRLSGMQPEELQGHSHNNPDLNQADPDDLGVPHGTPDTNPSDLGNNTGDTDNQPQGDTDNGQNTDPRTSTDANPDTDTTENNPSTGQGNDRNAGHTALDHHDRPHGGNNNHKHPWLTAGMTIGILAGIGWVADHCQFKNEDGYAQPTPVVEPTPTFLTRDNSRINIIFPAMPTPRPTEEPSDMPNPTETPTREPQDPTPQPTVTPEITPSATTAPSPTAEATPQASVEIFRDIVGEPNKWYTLNGWYLIDGDVYLKAPDSNDVIQTYDNDRFTAEEIIAGRDTLVIGDYGFTAHYIPYDLSSVDIYSDQVQTFIQKYVNQKFSEVIHDQDGSYQFDTVSVDALDRSGYFFNVETATRDQ